MDRGACQGSFHRMAESDMTERLTLSLGNKKIKTLFCYHHNKEISISRIPNSVEASSRYVSAHRKLLSLCQISTQEKSRIGSVCLEFLRES